MGERNVGVAELVREKGNTAIIAHVVFGQLVPCEHHKGIMDWASYVHSSTVSEVTSFLASYLTWLHTRTGCNIRACLPGKECAMIFCSCILTCVGILLYLGYNYLHVQSSKHCVQIGHPQSHQLVD